MDKICLEPLKEVVTYNERKNKNGRLVELLKDGEKTLVYLTTILPREFKGYHLHRIREANYVCVKGIVKVTMYDLKNKKKEEVELIERVPVKLHIPTYVATGLRNVGEEEAAIINFPNPPYHPGHLENREQVEYSKSELEKIIGVD